MSPGDFFHSHHHHCPVRLVEVLFQLEQQFALLKASRSRMARMKLDKVTSRPLPGLDPQATMMFELD